MRRIINEVEDVNAVICFVTLARSRIISTHLSSPRRNDWSDIAAGDRVHSWTRLIRTLDLCRAPISGGNGNRTLITKDALKNRWKQRIELASSFLLHSTERAHLRLHCAEVGDNSMLLINARNGQFE